MASEDHICQSHIDAFAYCTNTIGDDLVVVDMQIYYEGFGDTGVKVLFIESLS